LPSTRAFAGSPYGGQRPGLNQVLVADDFGLDEAPLEVGVDGAGRLGAVSPMWMVQARASLGPAVRKVCRPRVRKPTWTSWASPDSSCPYPGQQLGGVGRVESGHFGLDLGTHHHRLGRRHQRAELDP
jgi:hypothetical protein